MGKLTASCREFLSNYPELSCGQKAVFTVLHQGTDGQEAVESCCTIHMGRMMKRIIKRNGGVYADVRIARTDELEA